MPVILAHGAAGYFDEIFFIGTAFVFTLLMAYGWFKSRSFEPVMEDEESEEVS